MSVGRLSALQSDSFVVESVQSAPAFHRYRVLEGEESVLVDVRTLLEAGGDLEGSLALAPQKDAGFSPPTLAWVLRGLPITSLGLQSGRPAEEVSSLERFRDEFVRKIAGLAKPD